MSMVLCERCDRLVDTDYDCDGKWTDGGYIHWDCLTDEEQEEEQSNG